MYNGYETSLMALVFRGRTSLWEHQQISPK